MRDVAVSVVVPLYNKVDYIADTIASALAQTVTNIEIIVIDDGSVDGGAAVVKAIGDSRILCLHQANAGVAVARNAGMKVARGEYVAFLDADDIWRPEHLVHLLVLAERYPSAAIVANDYAEVGSDRPVPFIPSQPVRYGLLHDYFEAAVVGKMPVFTSACMVRRREALDCGGFPPGHHHGEDLALWMSLAARHPVAVSSYVGSYYRRIPGSLTSGVVREPDISMQTAMALADSSSAGEMRRELSNKIALAHALQCLRAGEDGAADTFLHHAKATRRFRLRWLQLLFLRFLPRGLRNILIDIRLQLR